MGGCSWRMAKGTEYRSLREARQLRDSRGPAPLDSGLRRKYGGGGWPHSLQVAEYSQDIQRYPESGTRNQKITKYRKMPRNYKTERNAVIQRWYGGDPKSRNPRPHRSWKEKPISPADCFGIPMPVNSPFRLFGHCMVWKYGLDRGGYGVLTIEGKRELTHRAAFTQTRGQIPENRQVNHLCNRPYCVQPSHLYAGTSQDNKDDSQIFSKEELLHAPSIIHWPQGARTDDPLLQRLFESNRHDGTGPWEPEVQPAQKPLDEFDCPNHDFAITMIGGESRICRICETSEFEERTIDEFGTFSVISEICPTSQTVVPIFERIMASEFLEEPHRDTRRRSYSRSIRGYGMSSHDLRKCGCDYCSEDRRAFRAAIQPQLTREESQLLDICERLAPQITTALEEASADMMEAWARSAGLDDEQAQTLREHHGDCSQTNAELTRASQTLEGELGYLLFAIAEFRSLEALLSDQQFQQMVFRWRFARMRKVDEEQVKRTILPAVNETANRIVQAWESEADELTRPFLESKPNLHAGITRMARALTMKQALELLRFEFFGRNSSGEQEPHPHIHCAASIRDTGRVQPLLSEFEEGMGYRPRHP